MRNSRWCAAAAVAVGTALGLGGQCLAAEKVKSLGGFGTLRAIPADAAKAQAEAALKAAGRYDQPTFEAVWAADGRSTHDRTVDSLLAGHPAAAAALAEARRPDAPAPTEPPAFLADPALDPFSKANLAAAYLRALAGRKVYEEALDAAKGVRPEHLVDPAGYLFFKAVAEHALAQRDAAAGSLGRLLDDVADAPDRYRVVATLLFFDVQNWPKDEKDLSNIGKLMDNSGRRLDLARAGAKTQEIQKKIVFRLDEKIKELENQCKGGQCNGGSCPAGGKPGQGSTNTPTSPMQDSFGGGSTGKGAVDEKKLRSYEENWGKLPEAERAKVVQEITRDLPPKYKPMIEDYFRSLNRMHGYRDKP